ncbi:unnamed protein product [Tuber aestivum]|uniref:Uncharacterized protein n=1 Tax=Tuber aestivum TaxID=59557 RepID=A0A292Q7K2_9PEZI|nr:unnamed protein product [Tuber aestivum]
MFRCAFVGGLNEESSTSSVPAAAVKGAVLWINPSEAEEAIKEDSWDRSRESERAIAVTGSPAIDMVALSGSKTLILDSGFNEFMLYDIMVVVHSYKRVSVAPQTAPTEPYGHMNGASPSIDGKIDSL